MNQSKVVIHRIASLDFLRGFAILFMSFFHVFHHLYDYSWLVDDPTIFLSFPFFLQLSIGLIAYLGSWNTFFLFISSIVNILSMTKRLDSTDHKHYVLFKQLITGFLIILSGYFVECFLYHGYIGHGLRFGTWSHPFFLWYNLFVMKTLQIIGWSLCITSFTHYILLRKEGRHRYYRNIIVYILLTLGVLVSSFFIHRYVDSLDWYIPTYAELQSLGITNWDVQRSWPDTYVQAFNPSFRTWFYVTLAGHVEPLFPCMSTAFIGAMIGYTLAYPRKAKKLPQVGIIFGSMLIISGISLILAGFSFSLFGERPSVPTYLIQLGGQLILVMIMFTQIDFKNRGKQFAEIPFVRFCRRWSMVSLTVFSLQIMEIIPRWFISILIRPFYQINLLDDQVLSGWGLLGVLGIAILVVYFYDFILKLWAKIGYRGTLEWLIIFLQKKGSKQTSHRLDVTMMLDEVEWIRYGELIEKDLESLASSSSLG